MKCQKINEIVLFLCIFLPFYRFLHIRYQFFINPEEISPQHRYSARYQDMQYYPGYIPIKHKYNRLFHMRFKQIDTKNHENSTNYSEKHENFKEIGENEGKNEKNHEKNMKKREIPLGNNEKSPEIPLKNLSKTEFFSLKPLPLTEKLRNSSEIPLKTLIKPPIFQEIPRENPGNFFFENLLTFSELREKASEFRSFYKACLSTFSSEIQTNRELKNIVIFSLGISGLLLIIICRNCCFEPIHKKLKENIEKSRKFKALSLSEEKLLLKGRKILKTRNSQFLLGKNENESLSSSSEENLITLSKMLKYALFSQKTDFS